MNRRHFVSRVALGGVTAACTSFGRPVHAGPVLSGNVSIRFVGMMGFVERLDRSYLVATPGESRHMTHVPFLMARAESSIAKGLGFQPVRGVIPEAFDTTLIGTNPGDFVYRSLSNTNIDVATGQNDAVMNDADEMAQMNRIAPGKRIKGNVEKWASSTVSLRGGRLANSSGHPDAGKVWSFGAHKQRLTDAVNFTNVSGEGTTIRLTSSTEARTYKVGEKERVDLWVFSAAAMSARHGDPTRLAHSEILFDYLVDAKPVVAECPTATGRPVPPTELPFVNPSSASVGLAAAEATFPPETWFCYLAVFGLGGSS